jgi:methyl-accepting chemotaxis protein
LFALSYANENHLEDLKNLQRISATLTAARAAQVHFKKQVQEWKNILLRGFDPKDLERYRSAFEKEDLATQKALADLRQLARDSKMTIPRIEALGKTHDGLGAKYRAALGEFRPETNTGARDTDNKVRGIDRAPSDEMDAVVDEIQAEAVASAKKAAEETSIRYQELRKIVIGGSSAGVAIVLIFLALSFAPLPRK